MKLRSILCGVLAIAAAVACKPDDVVETPKLDVDKTAVSVTAEAGQATFNVTTNQDWTASADADWVSVNPNNGKASDKAVAVTVTADDNDTEAERTATVTVKAGTLSKTVKVTQAAKGATPEPPVDEPEYTVTELYMLGDACDTGWSLDEMQAFANDGGIFTWTGNLKSEGEFRFPLQKVSNQWWPCLMISEDGTSLVYGTSDDEKVIYHVPETGNYTITINAKDVAAMTVEVTLNGPVTEGPEVSWGLMGCFVDNMWATDVPMTKEGEWIVAKNAQFTELTFKIRGNASWNDKHNMGYAPGTEKGLVNARLAVVTAEYSKANLGGDCVDIKLNGPAGTYDVYFSFENLEVYVMEAGYKPGEREPIQAEPKDVTYTVVGTLDGINWNNSAPEGLMSKEGNYYVAKNVPLVTAATLYGGADQIEFKIVETGTWDGYGVAAGTAAAPANTEIAVKAGGDNIPVTAAEGAYDVYFDKENGKVWVMTPGYQPGDEVPTQPTNPEMPEIPAGYKAATLWEGNQQMAWGTAMQALAYGGYNWATCEPGQYIKVYVTPTDPAANWTVQFMYADDAYAWQPIPSFSDYYNVEEIVFELTEELIALFAAPNNGFIMQGDNATATKVELYRAPAGAAGYALTMTNNTAGNGWDTQVWYTLDQPLKAGAQYEFKCVVKSTVARDWCSVLLQSPDGADQNFNHGMNLFTEWTPTTIVFSPDKDTYTKVTFNVGDFVGVVSIDNVSMKEVGTDVELIKNGDFEDGTTTGWGSWTNAQGLGEGYTGGAGNEGGNDTFDGEMLTQFYYAAEQYDQYKQAIVMAATAGVSTDPTTYQTTGTGKILNLTLHAEKSDAGVYIPVGTYTAGPDTNTPFTWQITGGMPEYNAYWGTYITDIVDGQASIVELKEGTVEVEYADGNYTITLVSGDIKLRYTGPLAPLVAPAN